MSKRGCQSVGIDLGTTYSSLAYLDSQLVPCVVSDSSGHTVVPSVVYFDEGSIIVGDTALELSKQNGSRAVQFVKLHMGDEWRFTIDGQEHTPESLSAIILAHMIREAEPQIGAVKKAVITVPAWFTEKRRRATEQAGRIAGLDVTGTLNEPMAAALAYGLHTPDAAGPKERNVLVYDLGGGTFDVTVMRITPSELVELATRGNRKLGGKDWDESLITLALDEFLKGKHGSNPAARKLAEQIKNCFAHEEAIRSLSPEGLNALHDLRVEAERAKRRLSNAQRTVIPVRLAGLDQSVELTRAQFAAHADPLVQSTRMTAETALDDAKLNWNQLDRVVLVGGSTHMPMVREMLQQASGKPPDRGINPVTAVALGAAIYAHQLESGKGPKAIRLKPGELADAGKTSVAKSPSSPDVQFVTAHGMGIRTTSGDTAQNHVLIRRNTPVPATVKQRFRTKSNRTGPASGIRVVVTQGDTPDASLAEILGTARITGIPPNDPPGQPVDIIMEFDSRSRLHLRATYVNTGQVLTLDLDVPGGLKEEQVKQFHDLLVTSGLILPAPLAPPPPEDEPLLLEELPEDEDDDEDLPMLEPLE